MSEQPRPIIRVCRAVLVLVLLGLALVLRFHEIGRQSFWHDEAFTAIASDHSIAGVLTDNALDVHPPLYYLGLYFWRGVFGDSDGDIRVFSMMWSLVGLVAILLLTRDIGGRRAALIALLLATINPNDIYFAREARMYAQVTALCTLGSWCLWRWILADADSRGPAKWWGWAVGYTLCAAAAIHTHYASVVVLLAQGTFALVWFAYRRKWKSTLGYLLSAFLVALAFLPWLRFVLRARDTLYNPTLQWISVPPISDFFSFLGKEYFWGQTWTVFPDRWVPTMILPLFVLSLCAWRAWQNRPGDTYHPAHSPRVQISYLGWLLFGPVFLAAIAMVLYHPIYWRPRFTMFMLPPFLALSGIACSSLGSRTKRWLAVALLAIVMLRGSYLQRIFYHTPDWRAFAKVWKEKGPAETVVFSPAGLTIPANRYLEKTVVSTPRAELERLLPQLKGREIWICSSPHHRLDESYYNWLLGLGSLRRIVPPFDISLHSVRVGEPSIRDSFGRQLDRWYEPIPVFAFLQGFDWRSGFSVAEFDENSGLMFRWSSAKAWLSFLESDDISTVILNCEFPPPVTEEYRPNLRFHIAKARRVSDLFGSSPVLTIDDWRPSSFTIELLAPPGPGILRVGWTVNVVNLARAEVSDDDRDLGLRINWLGVATRRD